MRNAGGKKSQASSSSDDLLKKSLADFSQVFLSFKLNIKERNLLLENIESRIHADGGVLCKSWLSEEKDTPEFWRTGTVKVLLEFLYFS